MIRSSNTVRPLLLLLLLTLVVFANCLFNSFVYDDKVLVVNNPQIRQLGHCPEFFVSAKAYAGERGFFIYRPLAACSYALDYFFWGLNPFGYHLTNLILHLLNVILIYFLVLKLVPGRTAGLIAGLIFAIHPAQVETVAWISSRSNLLSLFFFLAALLSYLHYNRANYRLSLILFILALFAKETALVFILIIWLYDYYFVLKEDKEKAINAWWSYLPFLLSALLYLALRTVVLGQLQQRNWWGGSFSATALTMAKSFCYYLKILFFPVNLSIDYVLLISRQLTEPLVLAGVAALFLLILAGLAVSRREKIVAFGIFWFLLCLLPVSNIIPLEALLAERFLYFPLIGFSLAVAVPLARILIRDSTPKFRTVLIWMALAVVFFGYGWRSRERIKDWQTDLTLWQSTVGTSPESPRAHYALGNIYYQQGEFNAAAGQFREAIDLNPQVAELYNALGLAWEGLHAYHGALSAYQQGLKTGALSSQAKINLLLNMGNTYSRLNRWAEARACYRKVLELEPGHPGAEHNLAVIQGMGKNGNH